MANFQIKRNGRDFRYEVKVADIPAKSEYDRAKVKVARFEIGYLAGTRSKGVNASLRFVDVEQGEGCTFESFALFSDGATSQWALILPRKNDKMVAKVADALDSQAPAILATFISNPAEGKVALQNAIAALVIA